MELDLRFRQFELAEANISTEKQEEFLGAKKPYQEIIDYLENNKENFYFKEFSQRFSNLQGQQNLTLSDGTKVLIGRKNDIMNIAIQYPDKTRFVGTWSNIVDPKEFYEKCQNLK